MRAQRLSAKRQTVSDRGHVASVKVLRHKHLDVARPTTQPDTAVRSRGSW
jgi:hypothetical protein